MRQSLFILSLSCLVHVAARADCIDDAARHHQVNTYVLRAIGWQESHLNPEALHRNANGTTDWGAFQINSIHLPTLQSAGITPQALRDGCVSAFVAAWHYRRQVDRYGNTWGAVGAYHSTSPLLNHAYANGIADILMSWGVLTWGRLPFDSTQVAQGRPRSRPRQIRENRSPVPAEASAPALTESEASVVLDASSASRSGFGSTAP